VIEVDGSVHDEQQDADAERQGYLEAMGLRVLRFRNEQVMRDLLEVARSIDEVVSTSS
jgi:very-short-patch-repair endonuclease